MAVTEASVGEAAAPARAEVATFRGRIAAEAEALDLELAELELLAQQARVEAERYERRRTQAEERLSKLEAQPRADPTELGQTRTQLLTVARRASVMEAQVEVLEGKRKALARFRDRMRILLEEVDRGQTGGSAAAGGGPAMSLDVMNAQEDLRRDIARQMHDGPAQSLTNIALQAQIVQRLMRSDLEAAAAEVGQLVAMVQQALDATKTFIFNVRPMVLDDLGLVPTIRRATRDRGRTARIPITFETGGSDQRLPASLESGLFRIIDDTLGALLGIAPDRIVVRLDWADRAVSATIRAVWDDEPALVSDDGTDATAAGETHEEMLPALAEMIHEKEEVAAEEVAALAATRALPAEVWRDIRERAEVAGMIVELRDRGRTLEVAADLGHP